VVKEWLSTNGMKTLYIEPGSPWENACGLRPLGGETFNCRFEDGLLDRELFSNLTETKVLVEEYSQSCNNDRPHSSLGYRTPAGFARNWQLGTLEREGPWLRSNDLAVKSGLS
jgi:putative transposase